jgi:alanyl-tRNA synthetase
LNVPPGELEKGFEILRNQLMQARVEIDQLRYELKNAQLLPKLRSRDYLVRGTKVPLATFDVKADGLEDLKTYADTVMEHLDGHGVVAVTSHPFFVIKVSRDLAAQPEYNANRLRVAFGKGGGRPELVQGQLDQPVGEAFRRLELMLASNS